MATRNGSATWKGNLQQGSGRLTVGDGAWEGGYSFSSRFEEGEGTNPEELIAAGHAACFSMALAHGLAEAGHEPESVSTTAQGAPAQRRRRPDDHEDRARDRGRGAGDRRGRVHAASQSRRSRSASCRGRSPGSARSS